MTATQALVLAGHGSQRHPRSADPHFEHARRIRATGAFDEVRTAFWKEEPPLHDVAVTVESDVAYVVPVLTSRGYFADEVFPRELGIADDGSAASGPEITYTEPVGTHDELTSVVEVRVESVIEGPTDEVGVAVVGHGTERNERSAEATKRLAARIGELGRYADVTALFLDQVPRIDDLLDHLDAPELVVVPLFVADGYHTTRDIPDALGHPGVGEAARIDGQVVHYTGAVGTEPSIADVIVERAVEAGARLVTEPTAPRRSDAARTFVTWIDEAATGREWGELVMARTASGYEVRHRVDVATPRTSLDDIEGPAALRDHVRHDEDGQYRPLSGASSLPTGWRLAGLDENGIVRAARTVYPGSVVLWHCERNGDLDVTDFDETATRQTGIYEGGESLDEATLASAVEAVCGDCVRRRCWTLGDGVEAHVPTDGGKIPCREACPFFLSSVHAFSESGGTAEEREDSETPVGALDDPGNRYRVRYARAYTARIEGRVDGPVAPPAPEGDD